MRRKILLLAFVALFHAASFAQSQPATGDSGGRRIVAVAGDGRASAVADEATVHVGFVALGPDSAAAYHRGAEISKAIVAALTRTGVPLTAIESDSQLLSHSEEDPQKGAAERAAKAYRIDQSWTVKSPAIHAAAVLQAAVAAGANNSGAIEWSMQDPAALHAKALADALANAKETAQTLARGMGISLGPLLSVANRAGAASGRDEWISGIRLRRGRGRRNWGTAHAGAGHAGAAAA